ncbi:MAG: acyl-CoA dehydratase activase [Phycisphaerae bacterium]
MRCYVGIDIGAVSATAALLVEGDGEGLLARFGGQFAEADAAVPGRRLYLSQYRRTKGKPLAAATELLEQIIAALGADAVAGICMTGSGSKLAADKLGSAVVNEFKAIAAGLSAVGCNPRTVFQMGGESSKYLRLSRGGPGSPEVGIVDYSTNGDCAAGTGSFLDQQAGRLKFAVEDIGRIVLAADRAAQVAGRCSVFAKSDMIHAQQKGYTPAEVLRGLCNAVARNFKTAVVRSHPVEAPVAFIGGVAANAAVVRAMKEMFDLGDSDFIVPAAFAHTGAIGAAVAASKAQAPVGLSRMGELRAASDTAHGAFPRQAPLVMDNVLLLRDRVDAYEAPYGDQKIDACLGLDVGSVSTNVVAVDEDGRVIKEIYVRTQGRPIEVVADALEEVRREWGERLNIRGVGTTGSGRELIGELVGADTVNDEITAHKTGAMSVGQKMLGGRVPDTIFEIGGQDAKFISLQDGIVVDFTMNEACAAGTGSFLEERAEELDISIIGQFAEMALSSPAPIRLGERCTVFMERDVNSYLRRGANKADLVAGLAYSVVYNYINRVVRGRKIGDCIFFQGGTAYNDAVAAAFSAVTGKQIIVPPYNGVIGAIGAALLAWDKMNGNCRLPIADSRLAGGGNGDKAAKTLKDVPPDGGRNLGVYVSELAKAAGATSNRQSPIVNRQSRFRGYDMSKVDYKLREFICKGCSNACQIQEFDVEGEKTYWGDKCSDRYRKRAKAATKPVIEDLLALRMKLLLDESALPPAPAAAPAVGIPMTMFAWETLPFWRTFLAHCGYRTVLSDQTNKKITQAGLESVVAEPCFPIIVAHGHVLDLAGKAVDFILLPNTLSMETRWLYTESHLCPWHQTMPFVIRQAPAIQGHSAKFLAPTVRFREGRGNVLKELGEYFAPRGISYAALERAVTAGFEAQDKFREAVLAAGRQALEALDRAGAPGIVLAGRPYNVHDAGVNLSVGRKLRDTYGVNCVPMDFLDTAGIDVRDINDSMYWELGRRILATAKLVGTRPNLHIIYITNFKCGPDSYIKHFIRPASGKPFLSLQFDGHSNDAGMMTRCEAYLDSKGILRPWRREPMAASMA